VSELSHDAADDGFHEIQLSGKQLVFLFIVTTTVIVVVFLCGVKVGRGARAAQGDEPVHTPAATMATPNPQPVPDAGPPAAEPPAPAAETPDELSYHERLKGAATPDETLKKPKAATQPQPKQEPAPKPASPASAPQPASGAQPAGVPVAGRPGTWAVQVIATRDRDMAISIVKRLIGKDYPAYLVVPPGGAGPAYYKVQIGRYDKAEAEQVSSRIKKEEQFQSWITR
jgi:cell division septation protein DedD